MSEYFIRSTMLDAKQAPKSNVGIVGWLQKNVFSSPLNIILTVVGLFVSYMTIKALADFVFFNAVFDATNGQECRPADGEPGGACWSFIQVFFKQYVYGRYPTEELWRPDIVFILGAALLIPLLIPKAPFKVVNSFLFFVIYPFLTLILLSGGDFVITGFFIPFIDLFGKTQGNFIFELSIVTALICAAIYFFGKSVGEDMKSTMLSIVVVAVIIAVIGLMLSSNFGLEVIETDIWGGFLVTLVVAITGIVLSLPIGIILALGRQSKLPVIKFLCVVFIEFWRGVPLITILFMAQNMIPLFLPEGGEAVDNLLRALIGVTLFASAYMAEVVRGGLQALPKGQYEGAQSLGLTYWQMMVKIILPQALKHVIPGIVNTFIGLFKDTTLVYIVGIFDLLGTVKATIENPEWIFPLQAMTGYVFVAFVFFIFCFGMSRYSIFMERHLHTGHSR